jgi:hypothetical protein
MIVIPTEPAEGGRRRDLAAGLYTFEGRGQIPPRDLTVAVGMTVFAR